MRFILYLVPGVKFGNERQWSFSILVRIARVLTSHRDADRSQRVQHADRARVCGDHFIQSPINLWRFIASAAARTARSNASLHLRDGRYVVLTENFQIRCRVGLRLKTKRTRMRGQFAKRVSPSTWRAERSGVEGVVVFARCHGPKRLVKKSLNK